MKQYSEHTPFPWLPHYMEVCTIVAIINDESVPIVETESGRKDDPHGVERESNRDVILEATRKYYPGTRLREAAGAFWSDTDQRPDNEKFSALLAAIVEYDNNQI